MIIPLSMQHYAGDLSILYELRPEMLAESLVH